MNLTDIILARYSTKEFDAIKKIPDADFEQIKALLQFRPFSSRQLLFPG